LIACRPQFDFLPIVPGSGTASLYKRSLPTAILDFESSTQETLVTPDSFRALVAAGESLVVEFKSDERAIQ
jgi:hypothetical protein